MHSSIHSFIHSLSHSFSQSSSKPVIHSIIHLFIRPFIHSVNCLVTQSFIPVTQVVKQSAEGRAGQWDSGHHSWGGGGPCRPARPQQRRASAGLWSVFFTASLLVHLVDFSQSSSLLLCLCIRGLRSVFFTASLLVHLVDFSLLHSFSARASAGLRSVFFIAALLVADPGAPLNQPSSVFITLAQLAIRSHTLCCSLHETRQLTALLLFEQYVIVKADVPASHDRTPKYGYTHRFT